MLPLLKSGGLVVSPQLFLLGFSEARSSSERMMALKPAMTGAGQAHRLREGVSLPFNDASPESSGNAQVPTVHSWNQARGGTAAARRLPPCLFRLLFNVRELYVLEILDSSSQISSFRLKSPYLPN